MTNKPKDVIERKLDFQANKVETLTLPELCQTASERNAGGTPVFGVEHHELFNMITGKLGHLGIDYDVQPIYAADGGLKSLAGAMRLPFLEKEFGDRSLQSWLLRRLIGSIHLKQSSSKESIGSLGISFHQNGIQLSYGQHIKLCKNMCIMGMHNIISTYGEEYNKITNVNKMIEVVGDWVTEHELKRERDLKIFERMKNTPINYNDACDLIGEMTILRVKKDMLRLERNFALGQAQISRFTERYLKTYRENPEDADNLWKLYNMGTVFHKAGETDIPLIIPNNVTLSEFLIKKYKLEN